MQEDILRNRALSRPREANKIIQDPEFDSELDSITERMNSLPWNIRLCIQQRQRGDIRAEDDHFCKYQIPQHRLGLLVHMPATHEFDEREDVQQRENVLLEHEQDVQTKASPKECLLVDPSVHGCNDDGRMTDERVDHDDAETRPKNSPVIDKDMQP